VHVPVAGWNPYFTCAHTCSNFRGAYYNLDAERVEVLNGAPA
jgi:hypothetical protein